MPITARTAWDRRKLGRYELDLKSPSNDAFSDYGTNTTKPRILL